MRNPIHTLLMLAALLLTAAAQPAAALVISEIMYHPVEEGNIPSGDETLEFIELYNNKAVFEDLSGWAFTNGIAYTFPPDTIMPAKSYLVIAKNPPALEAAYNITGVLGPYSGALNNDGERVTLSNENREIVISLRYNDTWPWPNAPDGTGHSLILAKRAGDPEQASSWASSALIGGTPGGPDQIQGETPDPTIMTLIDLGHAGRYFKGTKEPSPNGQTPTTAWTEIAFNDTTADWLEGPAGYGYSSDAEELKHIKTVLSDMRFNYISAYFRLPFEMSAQEIALVSELRADVNYDDAFVLYLNGTRIGDSGTIVGNPPPYSQPSTTSSDYPTMSLNLTAYVSSLVPGKNVLSMQFHNNNISNSSDCLGSVILRAVIQPATSGGEDLRARVVINELLTNSDAAPDWLELYNPGPIAVDLSHCYLSDGRFDLLQYKIPDGVVLQPGEFWAVTQGFAPGGFPFGLGFAGETVFLTAATDGPDPQPIRVLDAVRFGPLPADVTIGRYPNGANNFVALSAPTFGGPNAYPLINDIVINEIMYNHGTRDPNRAEDDYTYVELHNKGVSPVSLEGWAFTDGVEYEFEAGVTIAPGGYLVVAENPDFLMTIYDNLTAGVNLFGPWSGRLSNSSERVRLSYPIVEIDAGTGEPRTHMVTADEVTYYDGGRWPKWADGRGASLELIDPRADNNVPDAWADSNDLPKTSWQSFSFTVNAGDPQYSHDTVNIFDMMLLNAGEVLLDDLQVRINGSQRLTNSGFESGTSSWRFLGNHVQSRVTSSGHGSGSAQALHLIATGHGDPGANRINQSIANVNAGSVTFSGRARWLRGSRYLLMRVARELAPVQPPRPSHAFELAAPLNIGTPGRQNSVYAPNRGPEIGMVRHDPVLPAGGEPIVVTAQVTDVDGVDSVTLYYRSEGQSTFTAAAMRDDGLGSDAARHDGIYTGVIPGANVGTMRAFYVVASDGAAGTRFPTLLPTTANVPVRTCLVRVGDAPVTSAFATYRVWMSNDVVNTFASRANLSNELMDCTFVYDNTDVFYNCGIRFRGSPFVRSGSGRYPTGQFAYRIKFNADQRYRTMEEINLDNTEGGGRGPLQERASYYFYRRMGLQFSSQEYVRPVLNGYAYHSYEDVQKIEGDYVDVWFPDDNNGYIHKIDDYFEYNANGTGHSNLDEGLKYDAAHPLLKETYRWAFEKRGHRENDTWDHLFEFAVAMNTPSSSPGYEAAIESVIDPRHFAKVLAIRHAVGDWDSYGYNRGKNNYFYYAPNANRWYLLPWDIDFTLGSGDSATANIFTVNAWQFPEVYQFLNHPTYRRMYLEAFAELVSGPWRTSYGTGNPPTPFDRFLDDAAAALIADGAGDGRRDGIKAFVRDRRAYILTQIPPIVFEITTNGGNDFCTSSAAPTIEGSAPLGVTGIAANGIALAASFSGNNTFRVDVPVEMGSTMVVLQGLNSQGQPVEGATDSILVTRVPPIEVTSVTPNLLCNTGTSALTLYGNGFEPGSATTVALTSASEEIGFDALYVQSNSSFDAIQAATVLLNNPSGGVGDAVEAVHEVINLYQTGSEGIFVPSQPFAPPFNVGDPSNFAVRFTGYVYASSPGVRYFGVNSDDGFALWIDGQLVGEYASPRGPATTDVNGNRTAGTMTFNFPAAGTYFLQLDFFENGGGEEIEFFQTNSTGGNPQLINGGSELLVYRNNVMRINATNVVIESGSQMTCDVNVGGALPGLWKLVVTPECGQA
ncbi:MAG: lamin tail domain-containing protein, partial [Phycisphaerae bacterium]|nr:lamin tail domain-containing protein [Phycisphaerae bacterium]